MSTSTLRTRRGFIAAGAVGTRSFAWGPGARLALAAGKKASQEEEVGPAEDLIREHGVLRRVLLIYEEGARRLDAGKDSAAPGLGGLSPDYPALRRGLSRKAGRK